MKVHVSVIHLSGKISYVEVKFIDCMGDDLRVIEAARLSFSKEVSDFGEREEKLILYLAKNGHWSPFSHTAISFRMKAPVPIRTQCFKSKVGFTENEESRRYITSRPELFIPDEFRSKPEGSIKQGSGGTHPNSKYWRDLYIDSCTAMIDIYEDMINDGIAPEQARFVLPQGVEVNWIWTGSIAAYARYYNLRIDSHAQKEGQYLAREIAKVLSEKFPVCWKALTSD
jgi:thymidylate synthase (FAD)